MGESSTVPPSGLLTYTSLLVAFPVNTGEAEGRDVLPDRRRSRSAFLIAFAFFALILASPVQGKPTVIHSICPSTEPKGSSDT